MLRFFFKIWLKQGHTSTGVCEDANLQQQFKIYTCAMINSKKTPNEDMKISKNTCKQTFMCEFLYVDEAMRQLD